MLGIPETIAPQIAAMAEQHSWLAPMLRLTGEARDRKEAELMGWIEKTAEAMMPEAERAGRIVREVAGLWLERRALAEWKAAHPIQGRMLAVPQTVEEAVELGASEVMYASPEERRGAREMLLLMDQGMLRPPKE